MRRSRGLPTRKPTDRLKRYSSRKGRPSGPPFLFAGRKLALAANQAKPRKDRTAIRLPWESRFQPAVALHGRGIFDLVDSGSSMAEAADELSAPLGREITRGKRRFRLPFTKMQVLAVALGLFLLIFAGYALFTDDPFGGEPLVRIAIGPSGDDRPAAKPGEMSAEKPAEKSTMASHGAEPSANSSKAGAPSDQRTITIIDGSSGARHDVPIGGGEASDKDPATAPAVMTGIDPRLLEKSRYGMIPTVSEGLKPFAAYAGDADRAKAAKLPVIAIVVGGLGVGAAKTVD